MHAGKSSLVNSFLRVLYEEWREVMQVRCIAGMAEGGAAGHRGVTTMTKVLGAKETVDDPTWGFQLIDAQHVDEKWDVDEVRAAVVALLDGVEPETQGMVPNPDFGIDAVVVVVDGPKLLEVGPGGRESVYQVAVPRLCEVVKKAAAVRGGIPWIVVPTKLDLVTPADVSITGPCTPDKLRDALTKAVMLRVASDWVFPVTLYRAPMKSPRRPETDSQLIVILEQLVGFMLSSRRLMGGRVTPNAAAAAGTGAGAGGGVGGPM